MVSAPCLDLVLLRFRFLCRFLSWCILPIWSSGTRRNLAAVSPTLKKNQLWAWWHSSPLWSHDLFSMDTPFDPVPADSGLHHLSKGPEASCAMQHKIVHLNKSTPKSVWLNGFNSKSFYLLICFFFSHEDGKKRKISSRVQLCSAPPLPTAKYAWRWYCKGVQPNKLILTLRQLHKPK